MGCGDPEKDGKIYYSESVFSARWIAALRSQRRIKPDISFCFSHQSDKLSPISEKISGLESKTILIRGISAALLTEGDKE